MIKIYQNYKKGSIDTSNYYIHRYELYNNNIETFFNVFFPEIIENKDSLTILYKSYR